MNNLMIKHMKMKFKNLIKITSILVFSIIVVACSDDSYNSYNQEEPSAVDETLPAVDEGFPAVDETNNEQNICPTHNTQLDISNDGSTYCLKCLSESQQEAEARDAEEARQAEIQSQQEKTYKCKWCGNNFNYQGYSFNYSTSTNKCYIESYSFNNSYCSRKCANEACWSEH